MHRLYGIILIHKYNDYYLVETINKMGLFFLFEMVRDRRVLYRVQLTRPSLTELNQCAFTSDSYLFYSAPDI